MVKQDEEKADREYEAYLDNLGVCCDEYYYGYDTGQEEAPW